MNENKTISIFWYSQTGNSFLCCKEAAEYLTKNNYLVNICHISKVRPENFNAAIFIFVFPVYVWNLPYPVYLFLKKIPYQEERKKALSIITYASAEANTAYILKKNITKLNIDLVNYKYIRGQDSYIFLKKYWALFDRKDKPDDISFESLKNFLRENLDNNFKKKTIWFNPFNLFHWIGALPYRMHHKYCRLLLGKRIFLKEDCNKCRTCYRLCSTQAITIRDNSLNYNKELCIGCCGCINVCPTLAWRSSWFGPEYYFEGNRSKSLLKKIKQ